MTHMYLVCLSPIKNNIKRKTVKFLSCKDQKTWRLDNSRQEISTEISLEASGGVTMDFEGRKLNVGNYGGLYLWKVDPICPEHSWKGSELLNMKPHKEDMRCKAENRITGWIAVYGELELLPCKHLSSLATSTPPCQVLWPWQETVAYSSGNLNLRISRLGNTSQVWCGRHWDIGLMKMLSIFSPALF